MVQEEEKVISAHRKEVEDTMEIVREVTSTLGALMCKFSCCCAAEELKE
jgi:hypothetical protein